MSHPHLSSSSRPQAHHALPHLPQRPQQLAAALGSLLLAGSLHAAGIPTLEEVVITSAGKNLLGAADTASEGTVTASQLAQRPLLRPAEVLEAVPGMIVTQHSGDGKANQYFLRGFNLDHGSDFATHVMGMPINMVSHAHGQGYMDLNFLIPELIAAVKYRKGVYDVADGDFATSGSSHIDYQRQLPTRFVDLTIGRHAYQRLLAAGSHDSGTGWQWLGAAEVSGNDGPWEQPEDLRRHNAVLRLSSGSPQNGQAFSAMAYQADWRASEHVPERAIDNGEIGRYGTLSANDGGKTQRHSLSAEWARSKDQHAWRANAYLIDYALNLYSAPSGYISGLAGDQHEQADERQVFGARLEHHWFTGPQWYHTELTSGVQLRHDRIARVGLYNTVNRQRTRTVREDRILETASALYVDARTQWQPWLRTQAGLRLDHIEARSTALAGRYNMNNGGKSSAALLRPKLGVALGPFDLRVLGATEFYANWGEGFHSNDVRGATARSNPQDGSPQEAVPLIVKARGAEIGMRTAPLPGWNTNLTLWQMNLDSELVFVGDEGITEPQGASRRYGLEWSNYYSPLPGLIIDTDVTYARARFREAVGGGRHVPNAIPLTASLGVAYDDVGPWSAGLRLRYLGAYALEESNTQKSRTYWMANLRLGYRLNQSWQLSMDVLNLFGKRANDIEYWGGACSYNEAINGTAGCGSGSAIDGRLVHPLEPRSVRLSMRLSF